MNVSQFDAHIQAVASCRYPNSASIVTCHHGQYPLGQHMEGTIALREKRGLVFPLLRQSGIAHKTEKMGHITILTDDQNSLNRNEPIPESGTEEQFKMLTRYTP